MPFSAADPPGAPANGATLPAGPVERLCGALSEVALAGMVGLTMTEIVTRGVLGFSFEIVDEVGGYLLVALAFLSLPVCAAGNAFHRVELLRSRLSPRGRAALSVAFATLALFTMLVLDVYLARLVVQSHEQGAVAMTRLATPFWIPQLLMPLGVTALLFTLLRRLARDLRLLRTVTSS